MSIWNDMFSEQTQERLLRLKRWPRVIYLLSAFAAAMYLARPGMAPSKETVLYFSSTFLALALMQLGLGITKGTLRRVVNVLWRHPLSLAVWTALLAAQEMWAVVLLHGAGGSVPVWLGLPVLQLTAGLYALHCRASIERDEPANA